MDIKYILLLFEQHGRAVFKPLIIEAIRECLADGVLQSAPLNDDQVVGMDEALKLLGVKDRHSVYRFVQEGLPTLSKRPYRFLVRDIRKFNDSKRRFES